MNKPSPAAPTPATRRRYGPLWLMLLLFGIPYLAAGIFYSVDDLREALPSANHGQLISPLQPMPAIQLPGLDGTEIDPAGFKDQWLLVYWTEADCDETCQETLYFMRQVRLAMGRERFDIERMALLPRATPTSLRAGLNRHQPGMRLAIADSQRSRNWLQGLDLSAPSRLFVIDPQSRAALFYTPPIDPKHLLDDLERLLGGRGRG